ncbi:MAG TPA: cell division protein CrgA [Dermatophilaceae bacterium]|nr:cell division protein CrgA [Dermatophilaceae bacterium]
MATTPDETAKAKSSAALPPAAKAAARKAAVEEEQRRRAAKADAPNPTWWVPVFVTLLLVGLLWIVVFYVSAGGWPVAAFGYWNLVIGFGLLIAGFLMTMKWK